MYSNRMWVLYDLCIRHGCIRAVDKCLGESVWASIHLRWVLSDSHRNPIPNPNPNFVTDGFRVIHIVLYNILESYVGSR